MKRATTSGCSVGLAANFAIDIAFYLSCPDDSSAIWQMVAGASRWRTGGSLWLPDMPEKDPRSWPPYLAISLLHLHGITEITRTLQSISRDRNRVLNVISL